jgi:hypothetical protein
MDTDKLISLVRQRRGLWDREHPQHRSQYAIYKLWEEVAKELNSTSDVVRPKWQSLRHNFNKTHRRMQMRGGCIDDLKMSDYKSWRHLYHLSFLKSQCKSSASSGDIPPKENKTSKDDQTATRDEGSGNSQHRFKGLSHEKEQTSSHARRTEIPPKEKKTSRDDQTDTRDGGLESSQHRFNEFCNEKGQTSSHASRRANPPKGKKTSRDAQTDTRNGGLESLLHRFNGLCNEKEQTSSNASRADIPPKEKKILRDDQRDSRNRGFETIQRSGSGKELQPSADVPKRRNGNPGLEFCNSSTSPNRKHLCPKKDQLTSHAGSKDLPPKEKKILRADQTDSQVGGLDTSQFSYSGKELKPSDKVSKERSGDDGVELSGNSTLPHSKRLCVRKDLFTFHASTTGLPPEERNNTWHIHLDRTAEELIISQGSRSGEERQPSSKLPSISTANGSEEPFRDSNLHLKRLCSQKDQFTSHASTKDLPPKKRKDFRDIQTDMMDVEVETSQDGGATKELQKNAEAPTTRTRDPSPDSSGRSTTPQFKCLSFMKGNFLSHACSGVIPPKENNILRADQTDSRDGGSENTQFGGSGKELTLSAELPKRSGDDGLEFSKSLSSSSCKHVCLQKCQQKSHAGSGNLQPRENKISRYDQADTRDEKLESSKIMKYVGAPADILGVEPEASGPLSPNEEHAALSIKSHTTKHSSRRSYQTDVSNASTQIQRRKLRVSEDEHKARDEDTIFFQSLIPHIKGLSPARKMLLRIKTQELIYHFVYNKKLQIQQ